MLKYNPPSNYVKSQLAYNSSDTADQYNPPSNYVKSQPARPSVRPLQQYNPPSNYVKSQLPPQMQHCFTKYNPPSNYVKSRYFRVWKNDFLTMLNLVESTPCDPVARFVLARGYPGKAIRFPRSSALRDLRGFLIPEGGGTEGLRFSASSTPASPHMVLPPGKRGPQKDAVRRNQRTLS